MEQNNLKAAEYTARLLSSRTRILTKHPFYGLLLMHMKYSIDTECSTAYTDSERIAFSPIFLSELSDRELDFVMMHEILHVALMHCDRGLSFDKELFNIACDIVVNSNILKSNGMNPASITLKNYGVSMHLSPSGTEGYLMTAEEVYSELLKRKKKKKPRASSGDGTAANTSEGAPGDKDSDTGGGEKKEETEDSLWDVHSKWKKSEGDSAAIWAGRISDAAKLVESTRPGSVPMAIERLMEELSHPRLDWKQILHDFIEEDKIDYSFSPPDRRFGDTPFMLPDFNDTAERVSNLLFFIDTSGSVLPSDLTEVFSEIKGALERFEGRLSGKLGFFDAKVYEPKPFESVDDLLAIKPVGGGGTSFFAVFDYLKKTVAEDEPAALIILTDGYADFPKEEAALGIPVLWIITTDVAPPFGKVIKLRES